MLIENKRENLDNYLYFLIDKNELIKNQEKLYEIEILENLSIANMLKARVIKTENIEIYVKTSSLLSLDIFLKQRVLTLKEIETIIKKIINLIRSLKYYFLSARSLYLEKRYIYIDLNTLEPQLVYCPFFDKDIEEGLENLFKIFIDNIKDNKILSRLYEYILSIKNIDNLIYKIEESEDIIEEKPEDKKDLFDESLYFDNKEEEEDVNFINNIKQFFTKSKLKKEENIFEAVLEDKDTDFIEDKGYYEHTVLLKSNKDDKKRRLRSLINSKDNIDIEYFPFVIGRQERMCDYVLDKEGISRLHVKFENIEDNYVLYDLNSRNGVFVNSRMLENEEYCVINLGDIIKIGKEEYIFE